MRKKDEYENKILSPIVFSICSLQSTSNELTIISFPGKAPKSGTFHPQNVIKRRKKCKKENWNLAENFQKKILTCTQLGQKIRIWVFDLE